MIKDKLKLVSNERAVIIGVIFSLISTVFEFTVDGKVNWRNAIPVLAGIVIRQFVYGPKAVNDLDAQVTKYDEVLKEIIANVNRAEQARAEEGNAA